MTATTRSIDRSSTVAAGVALEQLLDVAERRSTPIEEPIYRAGTAVWAGLDVHARSLLAVTVDGTSGETRMRRLAGETSEVVQFCAALPGATCVAYEAGPTGDGSLCWSA